MTQTSVFANLKSRTLAFVIMFSLLSGVAAGIFANAYNPGVDVAIVTDTIKVFPEEIYENDQVKVNVTVENLGDTDAENVGVALYVDTRDNPVDEVHISSISPGEKKEVSLYWIARDSGNYTFFILADFEELIVETNEDNNLASVKVNVKEPVHPPFPPAPERAEWWNSDWHYRVPASVAMMGQREGYVYNNKMVYCTINFTELMDEVASLQPSGGFSDRTFYPDSVRVVEYKSSNDTWYPVESVGREIKFNEDYDASENANVTLSWVMEGSLLPHEMKYYYIYWDTLKNGKKSGEYGKIYSGIKNSEFEDTSSSQWKNNSEPVIPLNTGGIGAWSMSYDKDPVNENDYCYKIYRKGLVWQKDWYAKVYQQFNVPDGGDAQSYMLSADVYFSSDIDNVAWELVLDGNTIDSGTTTNGWKTINKNVTSYLRGKSSAMIYFRVYVTESSADTTFHKVYAYFDSCQVRALPNCNVTVLENKSHGWWGDIIPIGEEYVAGVGGMNTIKKINVTSIANPRGVTATIYSPDGKFVKSSLPLPDAGFEGGATYTQLYYSNEQTASASFASSAHTGNKAVELRLSDYSGKWKFEDQSVSSDDTVALRQEVTQSIHVSHLPSLYFWYNVEKYSSASYLNYTVLTEGGPNKFYTIGMGSLTNDGSWHKYEIPSNVLNKWRAGAGMVVGIEIRLVANEEGGENTVYIDDMGYSFMPDGSDRTKWHIDDFYTFQNGTKVGEWRLDVSISDGSNYVVERSISIDVEPAANLDVVSVSAPASVKEGEDATIIANIKNHGPKDVEEGIPINVSLILHQGNSDSMRMVKSISGLKKGETKKVSFSWHASYGNPSYNGEWTVVAKVNENGNIPEWKKTDNWNTVSVTVIPLPDLKVEMNDIGFDPSHPYLNDTVNITAVVQNVGYNDTTAEINFYAKEKGENKYVLIHNGSIEKIIGKRSSENVYILWKPASNGTYSIKVEAKCLDECNLQDNIAIKDIRVGGGIDSSPPYISNMRIYPSIQSIGEHINISATIRDNDTTVDRAVAVITDENGMSKEYDMERLGDTDIYYYNTTYSNVSYYNCFIKAFDTAGGAEEWQNMGMSDNVNFRVVYNGVETVPPAIRAVTSSPQKQVIHGNVNISALIDDESGIEKAILHVIFGGTENTYDMKQKDGSRIYYYMQSYDEVGQYEYYIEAIDSSANRNRNNTSDIFRYFTIPDDYDLDGVPDTVEVEAGADPTNSSQTVNVTVGSETGYLLFRKNGNDYVYWDSKDDELRDTAEKQLGGENTILFDSDGDGTYDHYYGLSSGEIGVYAVEEKAGIGDIIWVTPALILFLLVCALFIVIRKK